MSEPLPRATLGLAMTAAAAVGFGLFGIFARIAYDHGANVPAVIGTRGLFLAPLLLVFLSARRRKVVRDNLAILVGMALLGSVNIIAYAVALHELSPALAVLIVYAYPALVVMASHLLGWDRLTPLSVLAGLLVLSGVAVTIGFPSEGVTALGVGAALSASLGYSVYLLASQVVLRTVDTVTCVGFVMGASSLGVAIGSAAFFDLDIPDGGAGLWAIGAAAVVSTLFPMLLLFAGVRRIGSAWVAVISCVELVTAVVASSVFLDTELSLAIVIGSALVLAGAVALPFAALNRAAPPATAR
jgi:drug/metabolite transporter (DMT)-like permease